jgi:hypothetical protein
MRKLKELKLGTCSAKIYRSVEWEEYVVKFSPPPKKLAKDSDGFYHTDAKDDALITAEYELRRMRDAGRCG